MEAPVIYRFEDSLRPYREARDSEEVQKEFQVCLEINCNVRGDVLIKSNFMRELSKGIEEGNNINVFDLINFCKFFKDLYGKKTLSESENEHISLATEHHNDSEIKKMQGALGADISIEKLGNCLNSKNRKPIILSYDGMIAHEFLKSSCPLARDAICDLFNEYLKIEHTHGVHH